MSHTGSYPLTTSDNLVSTYDKWYKLIVALADYGGALEKDTAYTAAPSLQGLLTVTQLNNVPSLVSTRSARVRSLPPPKEVSTVTVASSTPS